MKKLLCIGLFLAGFLQAGTINIVLDHGGVLSGAPGTTFQYFGTLTNTTADEVFLYGLTASGLTPDFTINTFILNTPPSLLGNSGTGSILLFEVVAPLVIPDGPYVGALTLVGGADSSAQDVIGSAVFTTYISSAAVPEPQTAGLAALGLGALLAAARRRRQRRT